MKNSTALQPVRGSTVGVAKAPPVYREGSAPLPHPIPMVIGILVGTQVVIILSVLIYLLIRQREEGEARRSVYGEIGRSPSNWSGSRLWARLRGQTSRRAAKGAPYVTENDEVAGFLERWRRRKRERALAAAGPASHKRTVSSPIEFTIPTKTEPLTLVPPRAHHAGRRRAFPPRKAGPEPWVLPPDRRPPRAPALCGEMRSKSLHTGGSKAGDPLMPVTRMARSMSMPVKLDEIAAGVAGSGEPRQTVIGQIEPDLYRIDEQHELYTPSRYGLGKLSFSLFYGASEARLTVYLIQAVQLPARTERATADTFVRVALLPDEDEKRSVTSKIQRRTLNPIYRQNFIFGLGEEAVAHTVVRLTVLGLDRYSHPVNIGQVLYPLRAHDFRPSAGDVSEPIWRDIEKSDAPEEPQQGDILFSLTYLPNAERVTVVIIKARNLRLPESEEQDAKKLVLDTFVKVTVVRGDKVVKNKQTSVVRRNANPTFNEAFTIDMTCENEQVCIVFAVCLRVNPFAGHKTLGRCLVGPDNKATGDGAAHWRDMMATPRCAVAAWHPLK